jgi:transposase
MDHYAGIDVSLEQSSVCVVDAAGRIVREAKVASEPEALVGFLHNVAPPLARIGLEVVKRSAEQMGFAVIRRRWVVV